MNLSLKSPAALICSLLIFFLQVSVFSLPALAAETPGYNLAIPNSFEEGSPFREGLAMVKQGGKVGLIDKKGKVVLDFVYDQIMWNLDSHFPFNTIYNSNFFIVVNDKKWGVIDNTGKQAIPCVFDSIIYDGDGVFEVGVGTPIPPGLPLIRGYWGLWDTKAGQEILPPDYQIRASDDAALFIITSEKHGQQVIDRSGKVLIPPKYDHIMPATGAFNSFIVTVGNQTGIVDRNDHFIAPLGQYEIIKDFKDGYALVQKNYKLGLINTAGNLVVPTEFRNIRIFRGQVIAQKGEKWGVMDIGGKTLIPFVYDEGEFTSNGAIYMKQGSKTILFNNTGKVIAPLGKYDIYAGVRQMDNAIFVTRGGKVGTIDLTGKEIVPFIYTGVMDTKGSLAYVLDNDKAAVIDEKGNVVLPLDKYSSIFLRSDGYILVMSAMNGRVGLFDQKGLPFLDYDYYNIRDFKNNYVVADNEKGSAVFDKKGNLVVPFGEFESIGEISENMAEVRKNGLTGYISLPEYIDPPDDWAKAEVELAIAAGLVPEDMRRNYQDNITRADFCRLAVHMIELKTGMKIDEFMNTRGMSGRLIPPISFTDTEDTYVLAASRLGIVKGVGNNAFDPKGKISRQDAAVMLWKTAAVLDFTDPEETSVLFSDYNQFANYAVEAIAFVSAAADKESGVRVMAGTGNNQFSPRDTYTRQQSYLTMLRLFNAM